MLPVTYPFTWMYVLYNISNIGEEFQSSLELIQIPVADEELEDLVKAKD